MSESETQRAASAPVAARKYRSIPGFVTGVLMLALLLWLDIDAMISGHGRTPWFALASLLLLTPLIVAFTVWPVVTADADRIVVRNPLRTISAPWRSVESVVAALSVEMRAGGRKYVIWSIPVSLRQRKRAGRRSMREAGDRGIVGRAPGGAGGRGGSGNFGAPPPPSRAQADQAVSELTELQEAAADRATAQGPVTAAWTWWLIAPMVLGAIGLIILWSTS